MAGVPRGAGFRRKGELGGSPAGWTLILEPVTTPRPRLPQTRTGPAALAAARRGRPPGCRIAPRGPRGGPWCRSIPDRGGPPQRSIASGARTPPRARRECHRFRDIGRDEGPATGSTTVGPTPGRRERGSQDCVCHQATGSDLARDARGGRANPGGGLGLGPGAPAQPPPALSPNRWGVSRPHGGTSRPGLARIRTGRAVDALNHSREAELNRTCAGHPDPRRVLEPFRTGMGAERSAAGITVVAPQGPRTDGHGSSRGRRKSSKTTGRPRPPRSPRRNPPAQPGCHGPRPNPRSRAGARPRSTESGLTMHGAVKRADGQRWLVTGQRRGATGSRRSSAPQG